MPSKKLPDHLYDKLYCAYDDVKNTEPGSSTTGSHWFLIAILNECGYNPGSAHSALELAEDLLFYS